MLDRIWIFIYVYYSCTLIKCSNLSLWFMLSTTFGRHSLEFMLNIASTPLTLILKFWFILLHLHFIKRHIIWLLCTLSSALMPCSCLLIMISSCLVMSCCLMLCLPILSSTSHLVNIINLFIDSICNI